MKKNQSIIRIAFFLFGLFINFHLAAQCEDCPSLLYEGPQQRLSLIFQEGTMPSGGEIYLICEQDVFGPYQPTAISNNSWKFENMPFNFCFLNLNINVVINGSFTCKYSEGNVVGCGPQTIGDDCTLIGLCQDNLEDIILNFEGSGCAKWEANCDYESPIFRLGKVRIGDNAPYVPNGYHLAVGGGIITHGVKVQLNSGWADYVFENDYPLLSLPELAQYIDEHNHLPNTPSAEDVKKEEGFEVKKSMINQQEKIEEAFLYLIDLNQQINELEKEITILEQKNAALKATKND